MLFSNRRLCRHKHLYRTLNIPHSIASAYEFIDCVDLIYNEVDGTILIKPVRNVAAASDNKATAQTSMAATTETVDHLPSSHFSL